MTKKKETVAKENTNFEAVYKELDSQRKESDNKILILPVFKRNDEFTYQGKQVKVVEVLEVGRYHLKNLAAPYDSFIVVSEDLVNNFAPSLLSNKKEDEEIDLLYRPDDKVSL